MRRDVYHLNLEGFSFSSEEMIKEARILKYDG